MSFPRKVPFAKRMRRELREQRQADRARSDMINSVNDMLALALRQGLTPDALHDLVDEAVVRDIMVR